MLRVKFDKSDWLRIGSDYSAHAPKIGPSQISIVGADQKDRGLWEGEYKIARVLTWVILDSLDFAVNISYTIK